MGVGVRIAIDGRCAQDHFPGIGRYIFNLCHALATLQADLSLLVLYDPDAPSTLLSMQDLAGLPGLELRPVRVGVFSPLSQITVAKLLNDEHVDVYHSPYYIRPYVLPVPAIVTLHDIIPVLWPDRGTSGVAQAIFKLTTRLSITTARRIIVGSNSARADFIQHFGVPSQLTRVVHHGVDARFQPPANQEGTVSLVAAVRQRYALERDYILSVGVNKPHKNLVTLVKAFSKVGRKDIQLVFAGPEDHRYPETRQTVSELGLIDRVVFLGPVSVKDLPALYAGASLFAFPSRYEGFGLPVVEAIACGAPVICSSASSLPEVAGDAAILLDPSDSTAWTRELENLLSDSDRRQDLRARGLRRAAEFTWKKAAEETLAVYREAVLP
jgi:alpha-1,3-rhamnosyl/mannosyltransferase